MPVSFRTASHEADKYSIETSGYGRHETEILQRACREQYAKAQEILQSSFSAVHPSRIIVPESSGFVKTIVQAYNTHQALVIRPDDVWLAILTQFNAFVNANAEQLRSCFVAHEGKKELVVTAVGDRYTVDFGWMSREMGDLLAKEVVDKTLVEWIVPDFSTTTVTDKTVGCMIMMATLKAYFSYTFELRCGIPRVTLEGTKEDWEKLRGKADKLKEYGIECIAWYHLLVPVLDGFVRAFDDPNGDENVAFWQSIAHVQSNFSGPPELSGWITAFCVFNAQGVWLGRTLLKESVQEIERKPAAMSAKDFWSAFGDPSCQSTRRDPQRLILNDSVYHSIGMSEIPSNYTDVDVRLNDNGEIFQCMIVAGVIGTEVTSSGDTKLSTEGERDTLRPLAGWWMFIKRPKEEEQPIHRTVTRGQDTWSIVPEPEPEYSGARFSIGDGQIPEYSNAVFSKDIQVGRWNGERGSVSYEPMSLVAKRQVASEETTGNCCCTVL